MTLCSSSPFTSPGGVWREVKQNNLVLAARFLIRVRAMEQAKPKTAPRSRSSSDQSGSGEPGQSRSEQRPITNRKGSRTPTDAINQPPHLADAARALQSAHACRRSTAALAKGTFVAQGSASGQCFPGTVRSTRSYGPPTGAKIARVSTGVTRAGKKTCPSPASTSRTGHSAGRHDARAAREQR